MTRSFYYIAAAGLLGAAMPAQAAPAIDVSAYPELAPDVLLPSILSELRQTLADPYSIRDFTLCSPAKVKLKDAKPERWSVEFSFNAKNSYGSYTGIKAYAAVFRNGRISGGVISTQFAKSEGIEGLINNMVTRRLAACPTVPDEKIQQLLSPGASIYKPAVPTP